MQPHPITSRDHDAQKGATEDERPRSTPNPPGLDDQGMPNDETVIGQDAIGARAGHAGLKTIRPDLL